MVGDSGVAGFQRQMNIQPSGWLGEQTFESLRYALVPSGPHKGEQGMDSVAVQMINEAYDFFQTPPPPPEPPEPPEPPAVSIREIKNCMTEYLVRCIRNEPKLHYSQNRAMTHLGDRPENGFYCDCSGHSTGTYYWAQKQLGVVVPDPNRFARGYGGYNGYGWTGSLVEGPKVTSGQYDIGDLAIYGDSPYHTTHVTTCMREGDRNGSVWSSMGSERGPYSCRLFYRGDLVSVVRPGLTS